MWLCCVTVASVRDALLLSSVCSTASSAAVLTQLLRTVVQLQQRVSVSVCVCVACALLSRLLRRLLFHT